MTRGHSGIILNGRPSDLQPLPYIDPLSWDGKDVPQRRWLADDLIPAGNVTMLGGDGGLGKSTLAIQLMLACALGKPWIGVPVQSCVSIGVFCEDDRDELHRRFAAGLQHYGAEPADIADAVKPMCRVDQDNLLMQFPNQFEGGETTALYTRIRQAAVDHGAKLIVLDSLHDFFGGNENLRPHARQFIGQLRSIALEIEGAVLLTAHPSLSGRNTGTGESGSTAWNNTLRSRLYLTAPKRDDGERDQDYRELRSMKANYAAAGGVIRLRWHDGIFERDDPDTGIIGTIKRRAAESAFLACLDAVARQGRHASDTKNSPRYAPKMFVGMPQAERYRKDDLERAMKVLFSSGKIIVGSIPGPDRHPVKAIIRAAGSAEGDGLSD